MKTAPIRNLANILAAIWLLILPFNHLFANKNSIVLTCPQLTVDVSTQCLIPCEESTYIIKYCNIGNVTAIGATLKFTLDKDLSFVSASSIPIAQNGDEFTFSLGDIPTGFCGKLEVVTTLECDAIPGAAHCVEAEVFPNEFCDDPSTDWDESSLQVTSECENDSIFFQIQNIGTQNMEEETNFFIVIDDLIVMLESTQLNAGQTIEFGFPANTGSTFYAEVGQSDFHPGLSFPSFGIEGCPAGSPFTVGYLTQFPEDDQDLFKDVTCFQNTVTCPEVEKIAFPEGFTDEHFINQNQSIEYQINFSNTTDEIQENLTICDTISQFLDPSTLLEGATTHDYVLDVQGDVVKFIFENIDLSPNESGFVKFTLSQFPFNPPGSLIENQATVIWDSETTTTNLVFHTIPEPMITNETVKICEGDTLFGQVITENITFSDTTEFSIFTLINNTNVLVFPHDSILINEAICEGEFFEFDGETFTGTGIYTFDYQTENGCDSTVVIDLEVILNSDEIVFEVITEGETITFDGEILSETGVYSQNFTTDAGCDSASVLVLEVIPFSFQNCSADAGLDTMICDFTYPLIGSPEGGTWSPYCEISEGETALEDLGNGITLANFSNCGSYYFKYEVINIEEIEVFDSATMMNITVLDTCIAIDFLQIDVEDPSTRAVNAFIDMDLGYNDYECPESEDIWCKYSYTVDATTPAAIWKFTLSGNCLTTVIETTSGDSISECLVASIEFDTTLFSGSFGPLELCVSQDEFATVDEENLEILENNFWEYLDGIIGQAILGAAGECPPPPGGCLFPQEPMEIDSTMADTVTRIVPIRKGGFWTYQNEDGNFINLSDTTFFVIDNQTHALITSPTATTYNGTSFALFEVQGSNFITPDVEASFTFQWEEVWCQDTTTRIIYPSATTGKGVNTNVFLSEIPDIPNFGCGSFTINFKKMEIYEEIISCDETGYVVQITIDGGYPPHTVTGLSGTLSGNIFTSDLIPIDEPYAATVMDSCICERSVSGDACPCISPNAFTEGFVEMTCFDPCVNLFGWYDSPTTHPLAFSWFGNGGGGNDQNLVACNPGLYTFHVEDLVTGCSAEAQTFVDIFLPQVEIDAPNEPLTCDNPSQEICGLETGGWPDIIYQWQGGNIMNPNMDCQEITEAGTYTLTVLNPQNGCEDSKTITIEEDFTEPVAVAGNDAKLDCFENPLNLNGTQSEPFDLNYQWITNNGNILNNPDSSEILVNQSGLYILTVTKLSNGCSATDTLEVTPFPGISFEIKAESDCWNQDNGSIEIFNVEGAAMPFSFSVDGQNFQNDSLIGDLAAANYVVVLQDGNGCLDSVSTTIDLIKALPNIVLEDEYHICNDSLFIEINPEFDLRDVQYIWSNGDENPFTYIATEEEHFVEVSNKCEVKYHDFTIIDDFKNWDLFKVPNAFTPNRDGTNDQFQPVRTLDPIPYNMAIYDRWGNQIYTTNQDLPGWDGTKNGKTAPNDIYIWRINAKIENCAGTVKEIRLDGDVTLIR